MSGPADAFLPLLLPVLWARRLPAAPAACLDLTSAYLPSSPRLAEEKRRARGAGGRDGVGRPAGDGRRERGRPDCPDWADGRQASIFRVLPVVMETEIRVWADWVFTSCGCSVFALLVSALQVKGRDRTGQTGVFVLLQRGVDGRRRPLTLTLPLQTTVASLWIKSQLFWFVTPMI